MTSTDGPPTTDRRKTSLWNRDFLLLWQGQFVSQIGSQAFLVAMMFWSMQATGSASVMGLLMTVSTLPGVLLGPVGGTLADRISRRTIIIACDVIEGAMVLLLASVFFLRPESTRLLIAGLFVVAVLSGIVQAFFRPAIAAATPDLVPGDRLEAANSFQQFSVQFSTIVGQGSGGVLYALLGAPVLFLIDGVTFLFSAASESFMRIPQRFDTAAASGKPWQAFRDDLKAGLGFVWSTKGMTEFIVTAGAVNLLMMPVVVLLPFFAEGNLSAGAEWYGFLIAALSAGALAGFVVAGSFPLSGSRRSRALIALLVLMGLAIAGLGLVRTGALAVGVMFLVGVLAGIFNILVMTIFQQTTPDNLRGRVMGLLMTLLTAAIPVGTTLGGLIGDLTDKNIPLVFGACGALTSLVTLLLGSRPAVQEFLARDGVLPSESIEPA